MTVFYADPIDGDGNVIGTANLWIEPNPWTGPAVKIPHSEMNLEDMPTIHVREEDFPA